MEEAPSASSSGMMRVSLVPPRLKIKPIRAAGADSGTFADSEPDVRGLA